MAGLNHLTPKMPLGNCGPFHCPVILSRVRLNQHISNWHLGICGQICFSASKENYLYYKDGAPVSADVLLKQLFLVERYPVPFLILHPGSGNH